MIPLSIEKASLGSPSIVHARMATGSPRVAVSENLAEQGTCFSEQRRTQSATTRSRKSCVKGPMYESTAEPMRMSPVMLSNTLPRATDTSAHRSFSPPSPPIRASARMSFFSHSSDCCSRSSLRATVSLNVACNVASLSSTSLSAAFLASRSAETSLNSASASASLARLGATSLATRSYTSMAHTHEHNPCAALDAFLITSGSKSGLVVYRRIFWITAGGMLSLSYSTSDCKNFESFIIFLAGSQ